MRLSEISREVVVESGTPPVPPTKSRSRPALLVFVLAAGTALVLVLAIGKYRWFTHDEWDYLAGRDGGDIESLLIPHNEHWSTVPILIFRVLFQFVGLRSYLPYQVVLVVLHITVAVLLRVVMRRAGVGPWIATAAALVLVFFGAGAENMIYAVNVGFVAALVLGITHLLLADHDGPVDRRDWLGLLAGLVGLLCSSVALTMIGVVGLATLLRRGWRAAVLHTAPLAVVYAAWFSTFRNERTAQGVGYTHYDISSPAQVARFMAVGVRAGFGAIGGLPGAGLALAVLLVVGLVLAWSEVDPGDRRRVLAMPAALLAGAFASLGITGIARAADFGTQFARTGRYLYVFAALALPALAVAANAVARRWRMLTPVVLALLLVGIPSNVHTLLQRRRSEISAQSEYRRLILTLPRVPTAHRVPRSTRPEQQLAKPMTIGWLLDGLASGRVPEPRRIRPADAATATLHLALNQQPATSDSELCRNAETPVRLHLSASQAIGIHGVVRVVYTRPDGVRSRPVTFEPDERVVTTGGQTARAPRLVALDGPITLEVGSANPRLPVALCR